MEIAGQFYEHLKKLKYPKEITINDLNQVNQGVMKPILSFLLSHSFTEEKARAVKYNLALYQSQPHEEPKAKNLNKHKELLKKSIENRLILQKLKEQLNTKKANELITSSYKTKLKEIKEILELYKNCLKQSQSVQKTSEITKESAEEISKKLLYLSNETKSTSMTSSSISSLISAYDIRLSSISVFPILIEKMQELKSNLIEKINNFRPEEHFASLGVSLKKNENSMELEFADRTTIIDYNKKIIIEKQQSIWKDFSLTEAMLNETETLKKKIAQAVDSKKFYNESFKKLCFLLASKSAKKAEIEILAKGLNDLGLIKQEKENQSLLITHQKELITTSQLSSRFTEDLAKHLQLRREMLKKKLQTDEFIKKYVLSLHESIPKVLKPMYFFIGNEVQEYNKISDMLFVNNCPHRPENPTEEQYLAPFTAVKLDLRLYEILKILGMRFFANPDKILKKCGKMPMKALEAQNVTDSSVEDIYVKGIDLKNENSHIDTIRSTIKELDKEIDMLDEEYEIWEAQPAQHLIPWRRDFYDLNITEALELWKTSVNKQ